MESHYNFRLEWTSVGSSRPGNHAVEFIDRDGMEDYLKEARAAERKGVVTNIKTLSKHDGTWLPLASSREAS